MLAAIDCPGIDEAMQIAGVPIKFGDTPGRVTRRGPAHGEHTDEVLRGAGFGSSEIETWRRDGVVK
jgi:formyl-CoA transferase